MGINPVNPVVHFEMIAENPQGVRDFYSEVFRWPIQTMPQVDGGAHITPGGYALIDGSIRAPAPEFDTGDADLIMYVEVPDIAVALERVTKLGGSVVLGPSDFPGGPALGLFADPDGNVVGVATHTTLP